MTIILVIVALYMLTTLAIGVIAYKRSSDSMEDYFLANRSIGPFVFFFTLLATLQSAFAIFGLSGMAYGMGFGAYFFSAMATFANVWILYIFGYRIWLLGKKKLYVSPHELYEDRFQSRSLGMVVFVVMLIFSLPYLAVQPLSAGYALSGLSQGAIPHWVGVVLFVAVMALYTFIGGLRAVAWTDTFQGLLMIVMFFIGSIYMINEMGGPVALTEAVMAQRPELFRFGTGVVTWKWMLSMSIMSSTSILLAPMMFMRMFAIDKIDALKQSTKYWIPGTILLHLLPVFLGVYGWAVAPNLETADTIVPTMLGTVVPLGFAALMLSAAVAAMMSTADSTAVACSAMFTRALMRRDADSKSQFAVGRYVTLSLAILGGIFALNPPGAIFSLVLFSFGAWAQLFPATFAALYWRRANAAGCIAGIVAGLAVFLSIGNMIPSSWAFGFDTVVPALLVNVVVLVVVTLLTPATDADHVNRYFSIFDRVFGRKEYVTPQQPAMAQSSDSPNL